MEAKTSQESLTILTDLVLPGETNYLDNLFGGELLARMDRACSIAARRHSRRIVVTASVNHVPFNKSVPVGSVVTVEAKVSRAFKSSMEIYVDVWIEDRQSGQRTKVNEPHPERTRPQFRDHRRHRDHRSRTRALHGP